MLFRSASPDSQKAGLNCLCKIAKGRKIAVLGDMLEMGGFSEEAHRMVGEYAAQCGVDILYTVGEASKYMADSALKSGASKVQSFTDKAELTEILINELHEGDTIIFKASRGMKLEEIFESIYKQWDVE